MKPSAWLVKWPDGASSIIRRPPSPGVEAVPLWTAEEMARAVKEEGKRLSTMAMEHPDSALYARWRKEARQFLEVARYIRDHLSGPREETSK